MSSRKTGKGKKKVVPRKTAGAKKTVKKTITRKPAGTRKKTVKKTTRKPSPTRRKTVKKTTKGSSRRPTRPAEGSKKRRFKSGTVSLREIRRQQKSTQSILDKDPFKRYMKSVIQGILGRDKVIVQGAAVDVLQETMERYFVDLYVNANLIAIHGGRKGIKGDDLVLVRTIREIMGVN